MPVSYGVGTAQNKFALLDDDDEEVDPYELLKQEEAKKNPVGKTTDKGKKGKNAPIQQQPKKEKKFISLLPVNNGPVLTQKPAVKANASSRSGPPIDRPVNNEIGPRFQRQQGDSQFVSAPETSRSDNRSRNVPPQQQQRRRQPSDSKDNRMERRSGSNKTGVKAVDKRSGGGSHNWGSPGDEIQDTDLAPPQIVPAHPPPRFRTPSGEGKKPGPDDAVADGPIEERPEEQRTMTLAEWKERERAMRVKTEHKVRRAGEGEERKTSQKMFKINEPRKLSEDEADDEVYQSDHTMPQQQTALPFNIRFNMPQRENRGGFRGGRGGGGRGFDGDRGGGRGVGRGGAGRMGSAPPPAPPSLDDLNFPDLTLGGK